MAKCKKCGAHLAADDIFCPVCREKVTGDTKDNKKDHFDNLKNAEDFTKAYSKIDIEENKVYAILSYIPFVCFYPVFVSSKKSSYTKFHANQGLVFFIAELILSAAMWAIEFVLGFIPILNDILSPLFSLAFTAVDVLIIVGIAYGIYLAATGKAKEMPIIGKIRILK